MRPPTYKGYHEQQESKRQGSPTGLFDINHTVWYLIERKLGWTVATAIMLNVGCGISNRNREHGEVQRFYNFVDFCVLVYIIIYNRQVSMITRVDSQLLRLKHPLHLLSNTLPQKQKEVSSVYQQKATAKSTEFSDAMLSLPDVPLSVVFSWLIAPADYARCACVNRQWRTSSKAAHPHHPVIGWQGTLPDPAMTYYDLLNSQ